MIQLKFLDESVLDLINANISTEFIEGKTRSILELEFPSSYSMEELKTFFTDRHNCTVLTIGSEGQWYEPTHDYYTILSFCGYMSVKTETDESTGKELFENKLLVKLGKLTPEEIEIDQLKRDIFDLESAVSDLAFGGEN